MWRVDGGGGSGHGARQQELHISYHNGNHYNSVRQMDEEKDVRTPANVRINVSSEKRPELALLQVVARRAKGALV